MWNLQLGILNTFFPLFFHVIFIAAKKKTFVIPFSLLSNEQKLDLLQRELDLRFIEKNKSQQSKDEEKTTSVEVNVKIENSKKSSNVANCSPK